MKAKILIVEDESIEAMSFEQTLKSFGYEVVGVASTGKEAIEKVSEFIPDLILMDIVLKGELDGIETADLINEKFDVPIVYMTAHPEESVVNRAKLTLPYGYILKPVNQSELKSTIELALYKHQMKDKLSKSEEKYRNALDNMMEGCQIIGPDWRYIYLNDAAARHARTNKEDLMGHVLMDVYPGVFDIELFKNLRFTMEKRKPKQMENFFIYPDGSGRWFDLQVFPVPEGISILSIDITERKRSQDRINRLHRLYTTLSQINQCVVRTKDRKELFDNICKICVEYGKFRMAWIGLINHNGEVQPVASSGHVEGYLDLISLSIEDKPSMKKSTAMALYSGKVVINKDIKKGFYNKWQEDALKRGYSSQASIPIKQKGKIIGILNIYASEPNFFNEDEINLVEEIGTDISYALNSLESDKELKSTYKALSKSEKDYRELVDHSMVAIYKTNLKGDILFANNAMLRIFNYGNLKELEAKNAVELYSNQEDRENVIEILMEEGSFSQYEVEMKSSTGETVNLIISANLEGNIISGMMMDISKRKKAEKILKESEERFRVLISNSNDLIQILDNDGKINFDSPSSQRILGYEKGFFIGKSPLEFIHPDDSLRVENDLKEVYDDKNPGIPTEFRILKSDGNYIPVEAIGQNLRDVQGVNGIVVTTRPLTQQKIVEKALRKSERLLADIIDFLPDATFAVDHDGKIIAWNQAIEKMTDASTEDMIGKGNYEYAIPYYGERRPVLIDLIGEDDKEVHSKYDYIRKDGNTLKAEVFVPSVYGGKGAYLWTTASPLLDSEGKQYGAIESVRDITERKKAEFALKRSEERFRAVAESAVDAIVTTDVEGKVLFCNESLRSIFGYKRGEVIGKSLTVIMPERFRKDYINGLKKFKTSGEHSRVGRTLKTIGLKKDGTEFPFEMSLATWKSGKRTFFTSIIRDITEREKAENQIVQSLQEKEILLKEIHHRVKNNLQIISSLLDLQETYVKENETAVNVLKESQNRVLSMAMIHEMLYQSKDLSQINFSDYLRNLVTSLFHTYGVENKIDLMITVEDYFFNVETAVPMGLIISELVSNSLKYAFPDGRCGELSISIEYEDNDFQLIISDDGIGFPEDVDFKRVNSSLGLQLVNSLVNQLDGTIELDRSHGTRFIIKFKELQYSDRV